MIYHKDLSLVQFCSKFTSTIYPTHLLSYLFRHFADDTNIYFESDSPGNLEKVVNKKLRQFKKWLDANTLAINVEKTYFVLFHCVQSSLKYSVDIKIGNQLVKQAEYVKFWVFF